MKTLSVSYKCSFCNNESESKTCKNCQGIIDNGAEEKALTAYFKATSALDAKDFEESYSGCFSNDIDFVQDLLESCGDIPSNLPSYIYIDWERTARDIMMDYSESDGYYFRNL